MKYVATVSSDRYVVKCTGRTVHVFNREGTELARFRDIPYGYRPLISPDQRIAAVKSTAGWLAFYDLEAMQLIKKIRFSTECAQDQGFCFCPKEPYLYNIEYYPRRSNRVIVRYDLRTFEHTTALSMTDCSFSDIRYSPKLDALCVYGYSLEKTQIFSGRGWFIGVFDGNRITDVVLNSADDVYLEFVHLTSSLPD